MHLAKPVDTSELMVAIASAVGRIKAPPAPPQLRAGLELRHI
jgi:hypothetical protein